MNTQPSTQDAGGYMGDWQRGAPLGRSSKFPASEFVAEYGYHPQPLKPKLHLARIRLDSGGYDQGGAYWGFGGWLWECWDDAGAVYLTGRVHSEDVTRAFHARGGVRIGEPGAEAFRARYPRWSHYEHGPCQGYREAAKDAIREQLGEGVRFYR